MTLFYVLSNASSYVLNNILQKIIEEAEEVAEASRSKDKDMIEDEVGDLLFAVTNLARTLKVDPEKALRRTNDKFTKRFQHIENRARETERDIKSLGLIEMEAYWQEAKTETEKARKSK